MPLLTRPNRREFLLATGAAFTGKRLVAQSKSPQSIHWALLSDTHISADTKNEFRGFQPYENLKRIIPDVQKAKPESVLINGDLARLEGLPADYELLKSTLQPISADVPLCLSLGNHDNRKNFLGVWGKPSKGELQPVKDKRVLVIEQPPVRILVLDSLMIVNEASGLVGKAQRTWLDGFLKAADETPTIIFVHHNFDDTDNALLDTERVLAVVKPIRKVKAIVFGHTHAYRYDQIDGIHMINVPAVGYNFADSEPVGWVDSRISKDGGDFTLHAIGGNTARNGKTTSVQWRG